MVKVCNVEAYTKNKRILGEFESFLTKKHLVYYNINELHVSIWKKLSSIKMGKTYDAYLQL